MLATILFFILLAILYYVVSAIYLLTLHPLSDIPGPRICAFSRIPYWLVCLRGTDIRWMKSLHDKYGSVIRFGPTDLSYISARAWQDIHGPRVTEKALEFSVQPINGKFLIHPIPLYCLFLFSFFLFLTLLTKPRCS